MSHKQKLKAVVGVVVAANRMKKLMVQAHINAKTASGNPGTMSGQGDAGESEEGEGLGGEAQKKLLPVASQRGLLPLSLRISQSVVIHV